MKSICLVAIVVYCCYTTIVEAALPAAICLTGEFHKAKPGPETSNYTACHLYKTNTCCTAAFTEQLSKNPIRKIGNFSWNNCGDFGPKCQAYLKEVECFYQCSPNVGYWKGAYQGSFAKVPLCGKFCDSWFDACRNENTCAKNWIMDFKMNSYGENSCNGTCKTFAAVYGDGKGLCESMWGDSFVYKIHKVDNDCMHLNSSNADVVTVNTKVAERFKSIGSHEFCPQFEKFFMAVMIFAFSLNLF